jgi:transcriptional regulator with GAF, ATPase, and Fis domain
MQRLVPHDRMLVAYRERETRTFTVFVEEAGQGPPLHRGRYTTDFDPGGRYALEDWGLGPVFEGSGLFMEDVASDPRMAERPSDRARLLEVGVRARIGVPLHAGGRVIGAMIVASGTPAAYTEGHVTACQRIAELVGPFVENIVRLHRERHRRQRLHAITALAPIVGASLKVGDLVERLGDALRPVLDFDAMALRVLNANGRDLELVGVLDAEEGPRYVGMAAPSEYSTSSRIARGETILIHDAERELDPSRIGDRRILARGRRSILIVPLPFGRRVEGYVYFAKRRPGWYDDTDAEVAEALAAQIVIAVQHQRLAEEQQRLGVVEARARHLEARVASLRGALGDRHDFARIIGRAPVFVAALEQAQRVAPLETTVLLTGESGTGKEVLAHAIHYGSARADGPFVAINCAALPEALVESELFGHERGAFTGADRLKRGRFELAAAGTLFLDEIGELTPAVQVKLLRVLQEKQYERVGGTATLEADVRLVTATNRDLEHAVAEGRFRDDLFYRLAVFRIHLPALRERKDDVVLLADHFVRELGARLGKSNVRLSEAARERLLAHRWPGNIRELQNAIERGLIVSADGLLTPDDLGIAVRPEPPGQTPAASGAASAGHVAGESLAALERRSISDALARAKGNKSRAAAALGLSRGQLYTRLGRFGLD